MNIVNNKGNILLDEKIELFCEIESEGIKKAVFSQVNELTYIVDNLLSIRFLKTEYGYSYIVDINSHKPIIVYLGLKNDTGFSNIIPCIIFGDNHVDNVNSPSFPHLTNNYKNKFCSDRWQFRADRASYPLSMLYKKDDVLGISVDAYSKNGAPNGLGCEIDGKCFVSIGYKNFPYTFVNKDLLIDSIKNRIDVDSAKGKIFNFNNEKAIELICRELYKEMSERPSFKLEKDDYIKGIMYALYESKQISKKNLCCDLFFNPKNKFNKEVFRFTPEIGWTGGAVLEYPLLVASYLTNNEEIFEDSIKWFTSLTKRYNEKSGFFYDLDRTCDGYSGYGLPCENVNGWWAGYIVGNVHCAYTNGTAVYYLLKAYEFLKEKAKICKQDWLNVAIKILNNICKLQFNDGNCGFSYNIEQKKIENIEGFAGCYMALCLSLGYKLTKNDEYLTAAIKGFNFYKEFVDRLDCYGTPMDTKWANDQEGNLAFMRMSRLLYDVTKSDVYLKWFIKSANYEYLWRYCYSANQTLQPLSNRFNSCGGSITSVSNPHIHPMGAIINEDLRYLAFITADKYHALRADDGTAYVLQCLDLFSEITNSGVGYVTERFCPSDGLTIEINADGTSSSMWYVHNAWAAAAILEDLIREKIKD